MDLFVISDPVYFKGEPELINVLFEQGMSVFHLRKQNCTKTQYGALISGIDTKYHDRIALHQFHDLVAEFPAIKRIHYPEWLRKETLNDILNVKGLLLSTSIHQLDSLKDINQFNYSFYGPVFNSLSKPDYKGIANKSFMISGQNSTKLIALGGIDVEKILKVKEMGFDGLAVLGAIWNTSAKAVHHFKLIQEKCRIVGLM